MSTEDTLRRALEDQDRRWEQVHDMIETAREAVRLKMPYDQRPADLFKNLQDALYAIRGRTSLDDLKALAATQEQRGELKGFNRMSNARMEVKVRDYKDRLATEIGSAIEARILTGSEDIFGIGREVVDGKFVSSLIESALRSAPSVSGGEPYCPNCSCGVCERKGKALRSVSSSKSDAPAEKE